MTLCATCKNRRKDYEIALPINPDGLPKEFRTWMICELNIDGFPFKEECEEYENADSPRLIL